MFNINLFSGLIEFFRALSDVLAAGLAITAFSLFVYSLTFKIRDRLTNIFSAILFFLILIFGADAFASVYMDSDVFITILKVHWIGLILLPMWYFQFSDSLLAMTGKPSKGKRKLVGYLLILTSGVLLYLLLSNQFLGDLIRGDSPSPYFTSTLPMNLYIVYFIITISLSGYNSFRVIKRTKSPTSKRRMLYLIIGAVGPLAGSFPFLVFESTIGSVNSLTFWFVSTILYGLSWVLISLMTYAISFFGFTWPDREIKGRLLRWIFRGPLTASLTLGITTLIRRLGLFINDDLMVFEIIAMVAVIVLLENTFTLVFPKIEKILFYGEDKEELTRVRLLEERLFTRNDLKQFTELILANLCDRLRVESSLLFLINGNDLDVVAGIGYTNNIEKMVMQKDVGFLKEITGKPVVELENFTILPIWSKNDSKTKYTLLGFIGFEKITQEIISEGLNRSILFLLNRMKTAILDYKKQKETLSTLDVVTPQVDEIQNILAAGRFSDFASSNGIDSIEDETSIEEFVKRALTHLWGGPKLTTNPLLQLTMVQQQADETNESYTKTLRDILKHAIESLKPNGERQYTNDWLLYNILELKYISGMKMRDIAKRLALSEADLYRKQKVAIRSVSKKLFDLEMEIREI